MAFNLRPAVPTDPLGQTLPQADSAQPHDIPTGVSPTTSVLQDWIAWLRQFGRGVDPLPAAPADAASIDIDATTPYRHVILPAPASPPIDIVMRHTGTTRPIIQGQVCRLIVPVDGGLADGHYYDVRRESGALIVGLYVYTVKQGSNDVLVSSWVDVMWDGSKWRGLAASGYVNPGAAW